jgi:HrpA-like RNA helicase
VIPFEHPIPKMQKQSTSMLLIETRRIENPSRLAARGMDLAANDLEPSVARLLVTKHSTGYRRSGNAITSILPVRSRRQPKSCRLEINQI